MSDAVIVTAVRTPIGRAGKGLAGLSLQDIGAQTVSAAIASAGLDVNDIDDLLIGEVLQGGGCTARYIANELGLPSDTPGGTVQRQCATGMMAVQDAAAQIRSGMAQVIVAGGIESMTRSPALFAKAPVPFGVMQQFIPPSHPNTPDAPNMNMLITVGENTARECGITREESDHWSYHSNLRAAAAADDGRFASEVVPVTVPAGRGQTATVSQDEHPRRDTTMEKLAGLKTLHPEIEGFSITAGNACGANDGAAALVIASDRLGLPALATVKSWASVGVDPAATGLAPVEAIPKALARAGMSISDVDLFEINEAFAAMCVATIKMLDLDPDKVNVSGSGCSLGHPVAATGARMLVTLVHELRRRGGGIGVAAMCAGGGMGSATVIEVPAP
jgi:acetyl-CoA acyltransferase